MSNRSNCLNTGDEPKNGGLLVPFGLSIDDGRMYSPTEVPSGGLCRCICPGCKEPLVARHAKQSNRVSHFAHTPGSDCSNGLETAVHRAAKQLIDESKSVFTPTLIAKVDLQDALKQHHLQEKVVDSGGVKSLPNVRLEQSIENFRPDIIGTFENGQELCIEVAVTHFVDDEKLTKIQSAGIPTIEYDLSEYREFTWDSLRKALLEGSAPAKWVYHPEKNRLEELWLSWFKPILDDAEETAKRNANAFYEELEQARQQWSKEEGIYRQRMLENEKLLRQKRSKELAKAQQFRNATEDEKRALISRSFNRPELPRILRSRVTGEGSFGVSDPHIWQAALFRKVIHNAVNNGHWGIEKGFAVATLKLRFNITPEFPHAEEVAVWKYLLELAGKGALKRKPRQTFEILIADIGTFETLQAYRQGRLSLAKGIHWAGETSWPNMQLAMALAKAHGNGDVWGVSSSWERVATITSEISALSPVDAVTRYIGRIGEQALATYWISARFLVT